MILETRNKEHSERNKKYAIRKRGFHPQVSTYFHCWQDAQANKIQDFAS